MTFDMFCKLLQKSRQGYAEILRTQSATVASKMLPETQVSAALVRSASAFHELMEAMQSESKRGRS